MASPPILTLQNIFLTFGGTPLLEGVELSVHSGDRVCVVGRNGCGKSTFLKIAAGLIEPDSGDHFLQPGTKVTYMQQEPDFSGYESLLDFACADLHESDMVFQAETYLQELGLDPGLSVDNLSGGEKRRAALARAMAAEPDIMILDEPTNHLDISTIEWLEDQFRFFRCALILISHDRQFLKNLTNSVVWLDRGKTHRLDQGFDAFETWRDKLLEEEELARHKLDRKIVREEHWLTYGVTARRKRNVKRLANLHALRDQRKNYRGPEGKAKTGELKGEASGKQVIVAENISKSFETRKVVRNFSLRIHRGDRVGFVGPNGAGKTTLLKMLTGEMKSDTGSVVLGTKLQTITLDQGRQLLREDWSLKDMLTGGRGDMVSVQGQQKHVIGYMKDFLFLPEQAGTPVSALSGGERGRLMLALALASESNLLILDEPTNDLDLETLDLLEELLANYEGTLLLVSHDRDFLDRVVGSVIYSSGDGDWTEYAGGYSDMKAQMKATRAEFLSVVNETSGSPDDKQKSADKKKTVRHSEAKPVRLSYKQKYALEKLPEEIAQLESDINKLNTALLDPELFQNNPQKFEKLTILLAQKTEKYQQAEEELLELEILREEMETK